jgi:hypothetical protein
MWQMITKGFSSKQSGLGPQRTARKCAADGKLLVNNKELPLPPNAANTTSRGIQ